MRISKKIGLLILSVSLFGAYNSAIAQKKGKPKSTNGQKPSSSSNPFGNSGTTSAPAVTPPSSNPFGGGTTTTTQPPQNGSSNPFGSSTTNTNSTQKNSGNPFGGSSTQPPQGKAGESFNTNLPIKYQKSSGGDPLTDTIKPNIRPTSSILSMTKERMPLVWDDIREDDAIYRHKIWEIIDCREKINQPFTYKEDGGNNLFFTILVRSILEDSVAAFEYYDFRKQLSIKDVQAKCTGGMDTSYERSIETGEPIALSVGKKEFPIDSVYQFQLMEEVMFDKEASKLVRRIIAIAPMGPLVVSGKVIPGEPFPYFWVYYPDLRKTLAKKQVYNPKNLNSTQTWEDYLESHNYSYYVVKSTIDNVKGQTLKDVYPDNPMFRLFQGEKIKNQIFNYEQSLWAY